MAVTTVCSSPAHSTTLPAFSALKTHQPLQPHIPVSSSSSTKFGINLVSNDALLLAGAAQAVALARAAVQAAREAVLATAETGEGWSGRESGNGLMRDGCDGGIRRRRRRRRRKGVGEKNGVSRRISGGSVKSRYLSPGEEAELCLCFKEGARLEAARTRITQAQGREPTSKQLAKDLGMKQSVDKILCDGRESRERITQSYRRLVVSIAKGYQGKGLSFRDLIQEGSIGLLRGVEKFEPERGHKLSTYVYWWIKQAIIKAVASESRIIRLPGHVCRMVARIAEASSLLSEKLGRLPTHDEIAEVLDVHISTVRLVSQRSRPPISLDQPLSDQGHMTLQEIIRGSDETTPENMLKKQLIKQEVEELLKTLDKREEYILRLHFGINGEPPRSYEEIARQLKLSRERIRQINCTALSKLRRTSVVDDLELYIV